MELGMIGLGRMGANMVERLMRGGHQVAVYDRSAVAVERTQKFGAAGASSIEELISRLAAPRAIWLMIPAGAPVRQTVEQLTRLLAPGDIVIDGGNSNFH